MTSSTSSTLYATLLHTMKPTIACTLILAAACAPALAAPPPHIPPPTAMSVPASPTPQQRQAAALTKLEKAFNTAQQATVAAYVGQALQVPSTAAHARSATVYTYEPGGMYAVYAGIDRITDITLQHGERLTAAPVAGDTARWIIATVTSGTGADQRTHIIVKPTDSNIETDMMIPTNKRTYMLDLRAVSDWYMPSVRWRYPDEELARIVAQDKGTEAKAQQQEHVGVRPSKLDFNYKIEGHDYAWKPVQVFNDGTHTFIRMPANLAATDAPALFIMEHGKPMLVNYQVKGGSDHRGPTYIVDRLFSRAELRVSASRVVTLIHNPHWWQ